MADRRATSGVTRFDFDLIDAYLQTGHLMVPSLEPMPTITPDAHIQVTVRPGETRADFGLFGQTLGSTSLLRTVGGLTLRRGYREGLGAGHGGSHTTSDGTIEAFASPDVKLRMASHAVQHRYVGFAAIVRDTTFQPEVFPHTRATDQALQPVDWVGFELADIDQIVPGGLDGMRDSSQHPQVQRVHAALGITIRRRIPLL
jgi:hypothetical protein